MDIVIANHQRTRKINSPLLKQIVSGLFAELEISEAELGINLVGASEMARVNWQFLQHEGSTDVITFDHAQSAIGNPPSAVLSTLRSATEDGLRRTGRQSAIRLHGELFICVDDAVKQSKRFHTNWQTEVVRYVVHGVLHLLGYDDLKPDLRRKMKREENRLVRRLDKGFTLAELSKPGKLAT